MMIFSRIGGLYGGVRGLDPRVRIVVTGSFLFVAARMSLMTFLGILIARERGIPVEVVGLGFLIENVARGLFSLPMGALTDRVGRRPVLLCGIVAITLIHPLVLLVPSAPWLLAWSLAMGLAGSGTFPASNALLLDLVPPHRRQAALSLNYTAISVGYTLGVAPAGFLAARGFAPLVLASVAGYLLIVALYAIGLRGPLPQEAPATDRGTIWRSMARAPRDPAFLGLFALAFLFPLGIGLASTAAPLFAAEEGLGEGIIGVILSSNGVLIALFAIPVATRLERDHPYKHLATSAVLLALAFGALGATRDPMWALLMGTTLFTLGELIFSSALPTAVAALAPPGTRGAYQGAWSMVFSVGVGGGLFVSSLLRARLGWPATWLAFASCALLVGVAWWILRARFAAESATRAAKA